MSKQENDGQLVLHMEKNKNTSHTKINSKRIKQLYWKAKMYYFYKKIQESVFDLWARGCVLRQYIKKKNHKGKEGQIGLH